MPAASYRCLFALLTLALLASRLEAQLLLSPAQLLMQGLDGLEDQAFDEEGFGAAVAFGDFDCDGFEDLAVGVPGQAAPNPGLPIFDAGVLQVIYGSAEGLSARDVVLFEGDLPHPSAMSELRDGFGSVLAAGNFDDDTVGGLPCDDLAVGSPSEDAGTVADAGAVFVLYGDPAGLAAITVQLFDQGSPGVRGVVEANDLFGQTLAVGDFDGDGYDDLAVGAPGEQLDEGPEEGAVWALRGGPSGLSAPNLTNSAWLQLIHQDLAGLEDAASPGDRFGAALAACDVDDDGKDELAIGVPGQTVVAGQVSLSNAGGLHVLFGSADGLDLEGDAFEPGAQIGARMGLTVAGGDFDINLPAGPGCELAVGHPFQDVTVPGTGTAIDAGIVTMHKPVRGGSPVGSSFSILSESSIPGEVPEHSELFGLGLAGGDFDGDGQDEVLIGAPGEGSDEGALFWFPLLAPEKLAYRLTDFAHGGGSADIVDLGGVLAVGDVEGDGTPELAAGLPDYGFATAGLTRGGFLDTPGAVLLVGAAGLFRDGFESGDASAWSTATF